MIKSKQAVIDVQADKIAVANRIAHWLVEQIEKSALRFSICLSGGQTPKLLYQTLAQPDFAKLIPWSKVHFFWGDERFVPKNNDLSNYKMVKMALLDHVPIPQSNIHAVNTDLSEASLAASAYEEDLQSFYGSKILKPEQALFDVTLLGLGNDGHIASLFPNTDVLKEKSAWVKAVLGLNKEDRITLTYPALQSSQSVAFLVTGTEKSAIIKDVLDGDTDLPAGKLKPEGNLFWFLDQTAYLSSSNHH